MTLDNTKTSTQRIVARIQQDPIVKQIFKSISLVSVNGKLTRELEQYYITTRSLATPGHYDYGVNVQFRNPPGDLRACLGAILRIQGYRDRVCEIQVSLLDARRRLRRAMDLGQRHIYEMYAFDIKARGTAEFQRSFIATVFTPVQAQERADLINAQLDQVNAILTNLDKAAWAYKEVADIGIKLIDRLEGGHSVARGA